MEGKRFSRANDVVCRKVAGEALLVPIKGNIADMQQVFRLDEVGEFVWEHLESPKTVEQLGQEVTTAFDVSQETAAQDIHAFLSDLQRSHLVVETE